MKFIANQSEHLSKLTLYYLKKRASRRSRRAREPSRIHYIYAISCPLGPGKFYVVALVNHNYNKIREEYDSGINYLTGLYIQLLR